jgi:hypothetical protein
MITLMGALIIFCSQQIWRSSAPLSESRYLLSIGIAVLVIVLKLRELRQAGAGEAPKSRV